jgi:hypothetical protein
VRTPRSMLRTFRSLARRVVTIDETISDFGPRLDQLRTEHAAVMAELATLREAVSESASRARLDSLELARSVHLGVRQGGLRGRRLRVVLLVHNTSAWDSLSELWHLMDRAHDVDPVVVSLPKHFGGAGELAGEEDAHAELTARGVPHLRSEVGSDPLALLRILAPDVVFRQSQWDRDVDPRLSTANLAFTRLCLVPYEMLNPIRNVSRPGTKDTAVDMALHHEAWLVFGTAATVAAAQEKGRRQGSQFRVVGHPKLEALRAAEPEWPLPGRLPRVLFSTHHSLGNGWTGFGQLDVTRADFLEWARSGTAEIVWSPHPFLVPFVASGRGRLSAAELDEWRSEWDALPSAATSFTDRYPALLAACDVVVTDGISMLVEGQVTGRPVIFLEREGHVPFNKAGEVVLRGVHRVSTVTEARELAERLLRDGDPLRDVQHEVVHELFGEPGAAGRILAELRTQALAEGWQPLEREGHVQFNKAGEAVLRGVHRVSTVTEAREVAERLVPENMSDLQDQNGGLARK